MRNRRVATAVAVLCIGASGCAVESSADVPSIRPRSRPAPKKCRSSWTAPPRTGALRFRRIAGQHLAAALLLAGSGPPIATAIRSRT